MIWPKPSCASPFNFDKVLTDGRKVVHRILGPTAPQFADRSSLAASDSDAALRQHIQNNDIASSDPRLVEKIVARGSWLVKACHYTRMGYGRTSQRAAQGSLYRGAGRQRRSERLKVGPYVQGHRPCIFVASKQSSIHRLYAIS